MINQHSGGINLIMPMGGSGSRFAERGFELPKPLIPINNKPFFYWAAESIRKFVVLQSITFVVLNEHIEKFGIDREIKKFYPDANICILSHVLPGAVMTCLEGVKAVTNSDPIVFNDCDHIFICKSFYSFCEKISRERIVRKDEAQAETLLLNQHFVSGEVGASWAGLDGALLTFESADPKFSFLQLDNFGNVTRTVEKEAVSNQAICGAYYFKNRGIFELAANQYLKECTYKEFFISGVYNVMVNSGCVIKSFMVDMHVPFGTPEEYDAALKSSAFEVFL